MDTQKTTPSKRELLILLAIYLVVFAALAISANDRADWALENLFPISQLVAVYIGSFLGSKVIRGTRSGTFSWRWLER